MSDEPLPIPPATFEFLVFSLRTQAEMNMGFYHLGQEDDQPEPDLDLARHSIDLLAMLQEKTAGNLTEEEDLLLANSLTELRFHFVQASGEQHQEPSRIIAPKDDGPRIIIP